MKSPGELAIVLHSHMPYVEGYGTWPFGEEWLWEAIATCYLPLLGVLDRAPGRVTLSLTPVLCDQLEAPGLFARCIRFLREIRTASHALDVEKARAEHEPDGVVAALELSAAQYAAAADRLEALGPGLLGSLGRHADWTSSATHAILPLLISDAGLALQLRTGAASHRRRFGEWGGGFWLPECAYAAWLDAALEQAGVRATCVELTQVFGLGDARHLTPLRLPDGPVLWAIDREVIDLAWGEAGYPSRPAYRDRHALTAHHHHAWSNDGEPYDHRRALAQANADAGEFVAAVLARVVDGGVCVAAFDTELFGHAWHEGVDWLAAVIEDADRQGLALTTLDDALARHEPAPAPDGGLGVTSWGIGGDLRTWSGPPAATLAWQARAAELDVLGAAGQPSALLLRELLAVQASDWAFLETYGWAGDYARERAAAHSAALRRELAAGAASGGNQAVRNLAPVLAGWEG
jgi:1,4-alpha-glucan branching enzyme